MKNQHHAPKILTHHLNKSSTPRRTYGGHFVFSRGGPPLPGYEVFPRIQDVFLGNPVFQDMGMHYKLKHGQAHFVLHKYTGLQQVAQ